MKTTQNQPKVHEGKLTLKLRKNPYIVATIFLAILLGALVVGSLKEVKQSDNWKDNVCENMGKFRIGTPSWFDVDGNLVQQGAILPNQSIDIVNELLIPDKITMVHKEGCSWCEKQIEYFGKNWEVYKNKGLTIRCG